MKKIMALVVAIVMIVATFTVPAEAQANAKPPTVVIDGKITKFESDPRIEKGTTMVPFREIFQALGVKVTYDSKTKSISSSKGNTTVVVFIGQTGAMKNGKAMELTIAPYVDKGVTYVPLRFVGEAYGADVKYSNNTITINTGKNDSTSSSNTTSNQNSDLTELAEKLSNQVVSITTFDAKLKAIATGSGVIVSASGEILTNYHVIEDAYYISVYTSEREYQTSTVLSVDKARDLALIKIDAKNLQAVNIGDSTSAKMGESIITLGSPLGFSNTLSTGVISNKSRVVDGSEFIQITAPIDHGNSGGGLFNSKGELIGIITAKVESSANINLAIPAKDVTLFLKQERKAIELPLEYSEISEAVLQKLNKLQSLLDDNDILIIGNQEYEVMWDVFYETEEGSYSIVAMFQDYDRFVQLMDLQYSSYPEDMIGDMMFYVADDLVYEQLKIDELFIIFGVEDRIKYKPTDIPADYYEYSYGSYNVYYPFAMSFYEHTANNFGVYIEPYNNGYYEDFYIY